jgi:hypothetical protein
LDIKLNEKLILKKIDELIFLDKWN